jgi:hypothetical protein
MIINSLASRAGARRSWFSFPDMTASHPKFGCGCLECRVRQALHAEDAPPAEDWTITVDTGQALEVLCKVSAELLAHHSPADAKAFYFNLLDYMKRWKKAPHVMVLREPQGRA